MSQEWIRENINEHWKEQRFKEKVQEGGNKWSNRRTNEWMIARLKMNKEETKNIWKEAYNSKKEERDAWRQKYLNNTIILKTIPEWLQHHYWPNVHANFNNPAETNKILQEI